MDLIISTLLHQLNERHDAIIAGIDEIRMHCDREAPDLSALAASRVSLSRLSTERSRLVREVIVPRLLEAEDRALRRELGEMLSAFSAKRQASCEHVATWSSWAIMHNWQGYREASANIRAMMLAQIELERGILGSRLRDRGL